VKCKHCGQEIKKKNNWEKLKEISLNEMNEYFIKLCGKKCPLKRFCNGTPEVKGKSTCAFYDLANWFSKESK
jgi:hypothetical protein